MHPDNLIVEVDIPDNHIQVVRIDTNKYNVIRNNEVRHPDCDPETAMRALGFYLQGIGHKLEKLTRSE